MTAKYGMDETDVLEADFTEETGDNDVPIPDELLEDEVASPRYPLPDELIVAKYEAVPARFIPQTVALAERVILSSPAGQPNDLEYYQQITVDLEQKFPARIAYLRDLYYRVWAARVDLDRLQAQIEQERTHINRRNKFNNQRIEEDLKNATETWQNRRDECRKAIREMEDDLVQYKMGRQPDIESARSQYWAVRVAAAQELDDQKKKKDERRSLEEETRTEEARKRSEEARDFHAAISQENRVKAQVIEQELLTRRDDAARTAAELEQAARAAEEQAFVIEQDATTRNMLSCKDAQQNYDAAWEHALRQFEAEEASLLAQATLVRDELLAEWKAREEWLHQIEKEFADARTERENDFKIAAENAVRAVAMAGLRPDATADTVDFHSVVAQRITADLVGDKADTVHLALEEPQKGFKAIGPGITSFFGIVARFLALVALGCIFGISVGLLTGMVDISPEGLQKTSTALVVFAISGTFVFWLMGRLVHKAASYATEELHRDPTKPFWQRMSLVALLLLFLTSLEACVERYGIVQNIMAQQLMNGDSTGSADFGKQMAYWTIALIIASPFLIFHAYEGVMDTRRHLGLRRIKGERARQQHATFIQPELIAVSEAQKLLEIAQERISQLEAEWQPKREEAQRRLEETDNHLKSHPVLVRHQEFTSTREQILRKDPAFQEATRTLAEAHEVYLKDPGLCSARKHAEELRTRATAAHQAATVANDDYLDIFEAQPLDASHGLFPTGTPVPGVPLQTAVPSANLDPATPPETFLTWSEMAAKQRWDSVRRAIAEDPQVRFYIRRIESLQVEIHSLDSQYLRTRRNLLAQRRAIELRFVAGEDSTQHAEQTRLQLQDTLERLEAAQLAFDSEIRRFLPLTDGPRLIRWMHCVWQHAFAQDPVRRHIQIMSRRPAPTIPKKPS